MGGRGFWAAPPSQGGGVTYCQSLCASPINRLLHACLSSASSLPPRACPGSSRCRPAPASPPAPPGWGRGWVPPPPAAPIRPLPTSASPATGSRGAWRAPSLRRTALPPGGGGSGSTTAPWGALSSLTLQWGVPPAWCQPTEPQIPSPSPLCGSPPQLPSTSNAGGMVPKRSIISDTGTALGCHWGGDIPVEVRTCRDG